ncbi:DUF3558 domain-containing protein [Amycolatopsis sp. NPDC005961]|uniref:DUF3558 domain-containing protein n=1 Tax=Amycolatopsis sp. NPDC005961 TaxID=3156720 RepID=UPI0033F6650D
MRRVIILLSAALLVLGACGTTNGGTAVPVPSVSGAAPSSGAVDEVPGPGVPKVANPIDLTRLQRSPCDALTPAQVAGLLGSAVEIKPEPDADVGPVCNWEAPGRAGVGIIFGKLDKRGLTRVYAAKGNVYPFVEPLEPVDGYPLAAYDGVGDQRAKGECTVAVGTSDTQTIDISVDQSEKNIGKSDPCEAARQVTAMVLGNAKAGS